MGFPISARRALVVALAAAILAGCGGAQSITSAVPQGGTWIEASGGYDTPPTVAGTYRGSYTETRNGQTVKGRVRIVIRQKRVKIMGSFDIRGHGNPFKTYFVGRVKESPQGALLRFQVVWLGGYGNSVNVHARVTGRTLDGEGRSQETEGSEASRWKFKATKVSQ
jgi:hypothetical protein